MNAAEACTLNKTRDLKQKILSISFLISNIRNPEPHRVIFSSLNRHFAFAKSLFK